MKKNYTPLLLVGICLALLFAAVMFVKMSTNGGVPAVENEVSPSADLSVTDEDANIYLYTSTNCPHCQNVAQYLETKPELYAQTGLQRKSLDDLQTYDIFQSEISLWAQECGLDNTAVGIPFMYLRDTNLAASERCLVGDTPIIEYFEAQN